MRDPLFFTFVLLPLSHSLSHLGRLLPEYSPIQSGAPHQQRDDDCVQHPPPHHGRHRDWLHPANLNHFQNQNLSSQALG